MAQSIYNQIYSLLIFTITGIIIGLIFDVFRIVRKSFKTSDFITYIEDFVFWIITGAILLFVIFKFNNGEIRGYIFMGLCSGIIIYLLTISKPFIKFNVKIVTFIKKIITCIFKFLSKIFKIILLNPIYFLVINIKKPIKKFQQKSIKKVETK